MNVRANSQSICALSLSALILLVGAAGCGTTVKREATEQLLTSDAVDRAIAQVDFRDLKGQTVYFDTQYIRNVKSAGFVNAEYIISSLRQQLIAADCRLQDKQEDADFVVEARVGTLGSDNHEVIYGVPANNFLNAASSLVSNIPAIPTIPEISIAKKLDFQAAAKLGVFAYHRETRQPVWQSGIAQARSTAKDTWVLGAGPFQRGTIYEGTQFAGSELALSLSEEDDEFARAPVAYNEEHHFNRSKLLMSESGPKQPSDVQTASHEEPAPDAEKPAEPAPEQTQPSSGGEGQGGENTAETGADASSSEETAQKDPPAPPAVVDAPQPETLDEDTAGEPQDDSSVTGGFWQLFNDAFGWMRQPAPETPNTTVPGD